jgi:hypothetical protein
MIDMDGDWHFGQIMGTPLNQKTSEKRKNSKYGENQL